MLHDQADLAEVQADMLEAQDLVRPAKVTLAVHAPAQVMVEAEALVVPARTDLLGLVALAFSTLETFMPAVVEHLATQD